MALDEDRSDRPAGGHDTAAIVGEWIRRMWADQRRRRRVVIGAVSVAAVVVIGVAALLFASLAGESQSYRDGNAVGDAVYAAYSDSGLTAQQACRDRSDEPGQVPRRDDAAQWVAGCVAGFTLAQSDN